MKINRRNSNRKKIRQQGFRARMKTKGGRETLNRRRAHGRKAIVPA